MLSVAILTLENKELIQVVLLYYNQFPIAQVWVENVRVSITKPVVSSYCCNNSEPLMHKTSDAIEQPYYVMSSAQKPERTDWSEDFVYFSYKAERQAGCPKRVWSSIILVMGRKWGKIVLVSRGFEATVL